MFTPRAIGFVRTPYTDTKSIPKGLGARHDAGGVVEVLSELEAGLTDIDGERPNVVRVFAPLIDER